MDRYVVSLVKYTKSQDSFEKSFKLAGADDSYFRGKKIFVKPNIVFWTNKVDFPKWGVITTSKVVEGVVKYLKDVGAKEIFIGEGSVLYDPKDKKLQYSAYKGLGYDKLAQRYGVKLISVHEGPFRKVEVDDGIFLKFNEIALESDVVVNLPVLKTHAQTIVSLGIKNLKGLIDMGSRKKTHSPDNVKNLNYIIARFSEVFNEVFTLIDGIYSLERGPSFDGRPHKTDLFIASKDLISVDKVGSYILGYPPDKVPHILHAIKRQNRALDLSDIEVLGEDIEEHKRNYKYDFEYTNNETLPKPFEKIGIKGLSYPKYDLTLCTYCSGMNGAILTAIAMAWKGKPWDDVEILTGKIKKPSGKKNTIFLGQCMYKKYKDSEEIKNIENPIFVKGCPPKPDDINNALKKAGIEVDPNILKNFETLPAFLMKRYENKKEFDKSYYEIQ